CLIKNIPSGFRKDKIITPCNVSNKPALAMVKYCGIKPNCGGIIIVSIIATKSAFFPGNLNFANAYPANELINNTTIVTTIQRTSEFNIAPKKSILFNTFIKFSPNILTGVIVGSIELYAELGRVAITNIQ